MNEPTDIKALDEYLKRDSDVSRRYREIGGDEVPPELDRRVLAEARAAVAGGGSPRTRSWMRWSAPLALAASVVLVVSVVIESGVQNDASFAQKFPSAESPSDESKSEAPALSSANAQLADDSSLDESAELRQFAPEPPAAIASQSTRAQAPAAPMAPPPSLAKLEAAQKRRASETAREEVSVDAKALRNEAFADAPATTVQSVRTIEEPQLAVTEPAPVTHTAVESVTADRRAIAHTEAEQDSDAGAETSEISEVAVTGGRARRAPGRTAGPRNTVSAPARGDIGHAAAASEPAAQPDPGQWLEEIRELRRAGKATEADREWRRFREAYPDFTVAADDLAREQP